MFNSRQRRRSRWGHARIGILILIALQSIRAILRQLWIQHRYRRSPLQMTPLTPPLAVFDKKNFNNNNNNNKKKWLKPSKKKYIDKKVEVLCCNCRKCCRVLFVPPPSLFQSSDLKFLCAVLFSSDIDNALDMYKTRRFVLFSNLRPSPPSWALISFR